MPRKTLTVKDAGRKGGLVKSAAKSAAARENGKKGGYHTHRKKAAMRALIVLAALAVQLNAEAQSLRAASTTFAVTAAADWASTRYMLHAGGKELNPLYSWAQSKPNAMVVFGASMDAVGLWATNRYARCRPDRDGYRQRTCTRRKIALVGLYASSAIRVGLVAKNLHVVATEKRRAQSYR